MKNDWQILIGDQKYSIQVTATKAIINNEVFKLSKLPYQRQAWFFRETRLPIDGAEVLLAPGMTKMRLIVNGIDVVTQQPYQSMDRMPAWAYLFFAIHICNLMNGMVGGILAGCGIFLTARVATLPDYSTARKVLYSILILCGSVIILFAVVFLLSMLFF